MVVDPFNSPSVDSAKELIQECIRQSKLQRVNKEIVVVYNLFAEKIKGMEINSILESVERQLDIDTPKKRKVSFAILCSMA